jgi:hypothetical protein
MNIYVTIVHPPCLWVLLPQIQPKLDQKFWGKNLIYIKHNAYFFLVTIFKIIQYNNISMAFALY